MDPLTIDRIKLLHPIVRDEVLKAYLYINSILLGKNVRLRLSTTYRTLEEQKQLYATGRTKPGKIITNAPGGLSAHNYGLAFDIVLLIDKDNNGSFETAVWDTKCDFDKDKISDWMEVVSHFKQLGWAWGGDWKSFPDYPHMEKTFDFTPKQLLLNTIMVNLSAKRLMENLINGSKYEKIYTDYQLSVTIDYTSMPKNFSAKEKRN